jgi:hypothetical protein
MIPKPAMRCSIDPADKTGKSVMNGEEAERGEVRGVRVMDFLSGPV